MKVVFKVLDAFPEINADWLIRREVIVSKKEQDDKGSLEEEVRNLKARIEDIKSKLK